MNNILFTKNEIESKVFELESDIKFYQENGNTKKANSIQSVINKLLKQNIVFKNDESTLDLNNSTFYTKEFEHSLIFLQARFDNGFFIGFWSHSPWGTTHDQEQGWAIINPETLGIIDYCETKYLGNSIVGFREWRKKMTSKYGKSTFIRNCSGEVEWKISGL